MYQFGFRPTRSTEHSAILLVDHIRKAMDNGELTGVAYIDLSKAFDTVSHGSLISKLNQYGIKDTPNEWFTNYLFGRVQHVQFDDQLSNPEPVYCGVPQGSLLDPLLFLIHFNGIHECVNNCKILTYADDTVIFVSSKQKEQIEQYLNEDLSYISSWLNRNQLIPNVKKGKTECMLFGTRRKLKDLKLNVSFHNKNVTETTQYKYLGIVLDQSLLLNNHFQKTYKKASSRLRLLSKVRPLLTIKAANTLYLALVVPILTYCPSVCFSFTETQKRKLASIDERASRIISTRFVHVTPTSIETLKLKRTVVFVHQCIKQDVNENFRNYFETFETGRNTRNSGTCLRLPKVKLQAARKAFYFLGAKMYNDLPLGVRRETNTNNFKSSFDINIQRN